MPLSDNAQPKITYLSPPHNGDVPPPSRESAASRHITKRFSDLGRAHSFSPTEAAVALGKSEKTVMRWIKRGELPALQVGKTYRIERRALETFYAERMPENTR